MVSEEERSPEAMNTPTSSPATLVEQYKIAVELYNHEDNLNWTKLNHLFYVNAGLWAVMGLIVRFGTTENGSVLIDPRLIIGMVSLTGMTVSAALGVALWFGVTYMHNRKK